MHSTRSARILKLVKCSVQDTVVPGAANTSGIINPKEIKVLSQIVVKPAQEDEITCQTPPAGEEDTPCNPDSESPSMSDFSGSEYLPSPREQSYTSQSIDSSLQMGNSFDADLRRESEPDNLSCDDDLESELSLNTLQGAAEYPEVSKTPQDKNESLHLSPQIRRTEKKTAKRIRQKDYCYFCEEEVLNFARHLMRNHSHQPEVQKILSFSKKSKERNKHIISLRKMGNYIVNSSTLYKPMRNSPTSTNEDYLPCSYCFGYYKKKQLWRHRKNCTEKKQDGMGNAQTDAQNFTLRHLEIDIQLRDTVFPRMRADKISLIAKKDSLICAFGAKYLKLHREKHFVNVTSRKMRELAKLLIELRKKEPKIISLIDALQPQYYDIVVEATKVIASYDTVKDKFRSPTYAMNIATSLKQCANIAILYAVKKKDKYFSVRTAEAEAGLRSLVQLLNDNWRFDVSSQAADDLNLKKWNKVTLVPLASDLKLLKEHLLKKAEGSADAFKLDLVTKEAYNNMVESIYCRVLLLNRRRPGELQRLLLETYTDCDNAKTNYEEFDKTLSQSEKLLLKNFKRVVIRGKRNRGVPVLFSMDTQKDIKLLLSVRKKFIPDDNPYLFARPGYNSSICGYKILNKNANECGAKNADAISATRLRKHLATLTQILHMTDNDLEQLATFMGHTQGVHKKSYRLPDDVYQTAKMSKLLLLMEDGKADQFKGKTLEEIDLNLDDILVGDDNDEEVEKEECDILENLDMCMNEIIGKNAQNNQEQKNSEEEKENVEPTRPRKMKRILTPWTEDQKAKAKEYFKENIKRRIAPKKNKCEDLIAQHPQLFHNKNWLKVKVFIQNVYTKKTN